MEKTIEIPEGYEARIEGNKVILEQKDERIRWYVTLVVKDWWRKIAEVTDDGKWPTEEEMLAYLERQKEKKPAEWSEEDERMLGECIDAASGYYDPKDKQMMKDWLKSLRPAWKQPSEEQMRNLRCVISGCSYDIEPLIELENNLQNL